MPFSAFFYSKDSEHLQRWLVQHLRFGRYIRERETQQLMLLTGKYAELQNDRLVLNAHSARLAIPRTPGAARVEAREDVGRALGATVTSTSLLIGFTLLVGHEPRQDQSYDLFS